jgi:hypothetical protein
LVRRGEIFLNLMALGVRGGFKGVDFLENPPGSPFVKGESQSLNLMAVRV